MLQTELEQPNISNSNSVPPLGCIKTFDGRDIDLAVKKPINAAEAIFLEQQGLASYYIATT